MISQNVPAEVLIFDSFCKHAFDVGRIDALVLWFQVRSFETDLLKQFFHYGLQAARADVLLVLVYLEREMRDLIDRFVSEIDNHIFGGHHRLILFDQSVLWLGKNAFEIVDGQRFQFDTNGEATLQFRNQV